MKVVFCSSAIIKNKNGEILLMSRKQKDSFINSWEFPGGKLKNNEILTIVIQKLEKLFFYYVFR